MSSRYLFNIYYFLKGKIWENYKNKAYPLRVDEELMNKITEIAEKENRTRNKQIEYILLNYVKEYEAKQEKGTEH